MLRQAVGCLLLVLCCAVGGARAQAPEDPLEEAQAEFDAAGKLFAEGQYTQALIRAERSRSLREAVLGSKHPDVADSLNRIAVSYVRQGLYDRAEPLHLRALLIREGAYGENHSKVAESLNNLAILYWEQGLLARATPLYQRALRIFEATLGPHHPKTAVTLYNLANLYFDQGLYAQAESSHQRAITLQEEQPDAASSSQLAASIDGLARLYRKQGLYDRAESFFLRALKLEEDNRGKSHPDVAIPLHGLALLYFDQGQYTHAEALFQRALSIEETALGVNHPSVALTLRNMAMLYAAQGEYNRAETLCQRALSIQEAALGPHHSDLAGTLNDLAGLYAEQGRYEQAEALWLRAVDIRRTLLGPKHPNVATPLHNLATLYVDQERYARAEPLLKQALAIREAALGPEHPVTASSLHSLATLHLGQGRYSQAEPLYQRALHIQEKVLGVNHPRIAELLGNLAQLRLAQNRLTDALPLYTRSFSISEQRLRQEALDFSESRLSHFLQFVRTSEEALYALARAHPGDSRVQRLALGAALLLKGRSVEETANISRAVTRSLGPQDQARFQRLRDLRTQLAALAFINPDAPATPEQLQQRKALADEVDALEAELAQRSAPLRALAELPPLAEIVDRVAASLPPGSALIEFVTYADKPLIPAPPGQRDGPPRYLAMVLFPDTSIRIVDLGPTGPIDQAASRLRDALAHTGEAFQAPALEIKRRVFQPLRAVLGDTRRLLVAPDGQLNLVPFAALPEGDDFLLDTFDFTYLTSGRELLARPPGVVPASSVFVLADPRFSLPPPAVPAPASTPVSPASSALGRFLTSHPDLSRGDYEPLPGTRREAEDIQRLLPQAQLYLGAEATKERLLGLPTPGILHLATHGFFLGDAPPAAPGSRGVFDPGLPAGPPPPQPEPLLNSGLVLAGARAPDESEDIMSRSKGTLVTALELTGLDLWGTQLVVLSACDTGRGEVLQGQGVQGLRRALVVAGAETVISSLWRVKDDSTQQLMEAYYRHLLSGEGRASALQAAMRSLRETHPHPHHWAPFIALGSDAPLRGIAPGAAWASERP